MEELVAVGAAFVTETLREELGLAVARECSMEGRKRWGAYGIGHDDGTDHAGAEIALLASGGVERHGGVRCWWWFESKLACHSKKLVATLEVQHSSLMHLAEIYN